MNIPNYEECVKYALSMKGITGDTFKDTDLRVYKRHTANPGTVFTALRKGGIVIPIVNASLLGEYNVEMTATVVVKANQISDMVDLYVPKSNDIQTFSIATFVEAWDATGGLCTTAFPADNKTYNPKLINLKHVELPEGFDELREAIAENAHDMWALERQSEGWTYGPKRDDNKLETPDMVPYAKLPESEKQYDRIMAEDTLKLLTALGYKIEKNGKLLLYVMTPNQIEELCKEKEQELFNKYFGDLVKKAVVERPEVIGEYTKDLPLKIESEYKAYLEELWKEHAPEGLKGKPLILEEQKLRKLMTDDDRESVDAAYKDATEQTLWERITKTNHKDVTYYKGLLQEYTRDLLMVMREDFLEEITGHHIENKAFED